MTTPTNRRKRGISPIIATVVLLAITVAVGVALASYSTGLFSSYTSTSALKIINAKVTKDTNNRGGVELVIANEGGKQDRITSIQIAGFNAVTTLSPNPAVISPASSTTVKVLSSTNAFAGGTPPEIGSSVTLTVKTASGSTLTYVATVSSGSVT